MEGQLDIRHMKKRFLQAIALRLSTQKHYGAGNRKIEIRRETEIEVVETLQGATE